MPSTSTVRSFLKTRRETQLNGGPTAIVVGGTSGVGESIAKQLSAIYDRPQIRIVGRNEEAGRKILLEMSKLNEKREELPTSPLPQFTFSKLDATSLSSIKKWTNEIKKEYKKINLLVLSPGILTMKGRDETEEGLDRKMVLHYYARFLIIHELIPLLQAAKSLGEEARVMSVLDARTSGIDVSKEDDLDLKDSFSLKRAADFCTTYNDLMVEEFSRRNEGIAFVHAFPGVVNTSIIENLPWYIKYPMKPLMGLATSAETCGEHMTYGLTCDEFKCGAHRMNSSGDSSGKNRYDNDENRKIVWNHSRKITQLTD